MRRNNAVLICLFIVFGLQLSCDDLARIDFPEVSTNEVETLGIEATFNANIKADDLEEITEYGFTWSDKTQTPEVDINPTQVIGQTATDNTFDWTSNDWDADVTQYHVRAYIKLRNGIKYGNSKAFTFKTFVLVMNDDDVEVVNDSARLSAFLAVVDSNEFDGVLDYGHIVSTQSDPELLDGDIIRLSSGPRDHTAGFVIQSYTGLQFNTNYFTRAYAITTDDTVYTSTIDFRTDDGWNKLDDLEWAFSGGVAAFYKDTTGVMGMGCRSSCTQEYKLWTMAPEEMDSENRQIEINGGIPSDIEDLRRRSGVGFVFGNKFYFGLGIDLSTAIRYREFYSYNLKEMPSNWESIAESFPGVPRSHSIGIAFNGKAYVGLGRSQNNIPLGDIWVFDPITETWTDSMHIPDEVSISGGLYGATAVATDDAIYILCGNTGLSASNKVWQYKPNAPANEQWTEMASFPGDDGGKRWQATGFSIHGKVYVGLGINGDSSKDYKDFHVLDPALNTWKGIAPFEGESRFAAVAYVANDVAYIGSGLSYLFGHLSDFWRYTPSED